MAELSTVARPYAEALFKLAQNDKALDAWSAVLAELAALVALDSVREALSDPRLSNHQRSELLRGLLAPTKDGRVSADAIQRFVDLLLDNGRTLALPEIATQFEQLKNRLQGTALAHITSAFALSDTQVQQLLTVLEQKFALKLKPEVMVDENLIGGVRVVVGDQVLDTSVRAQLDRMQDALAVAA